MTRKPLSRRNFLKFLAAGTAAAGGYALYEAAPWLNYPAQAASTWKPAEASATSLRALVHYATLAASGHNTQPWQFALTENAVEIRPDFSRRLAAVDPQDRELWISLGCALENLLIAARAAGLQPEVTYPAGPSAAIHVRLAPGEVRASALLDAIPLRQNTRSAYDGRAIPSADLDLLQALDLEPGVELRFLTTRSGIDQALEYVHSGNLQQYADSAFLAELISWLRFNQREALSNLDGLFTACSGNPQVPRWLGKAFITSTNPQQQADADGQKLKSSPAAVVIASTADDPAAWVRTGQVYERLALQMTALNIRSAFLNQPIEVSQLRSQFQSAAGLGASLPQLLVRFGYAPAMPRSLRRPLDAVLV